MTHIEKLDSNRDFWGVSTSHIIGPYGKIDHNEQDMWRWLRDTPGGDYSLGGQTIYFYDQGDATLFALKWS